MCPRHTLLFTFCSPTFAAPNAHYELHMTFSSEVHAFAKLNKSHDDEYVWPNFGGAFPCGSESVYKYENRVSFYFSRVDKMITFRWVVESRLMRWIRIERERKGQKADDTWHENIFRFYSKTELHGFGHGYTGLVQFVFRLLVRYSCSP